MLRQQTYKAVLNSVSLSTAMAYVLDHADQGVPKTYWTGHAFRERRSCLFEFLKRYTLFA